MTSNSLDAGVGRGLKLLRRSRLPSGELKVYVSPDLIPERDCIFDGPPFPAALIAYTPDRMLL
ncbi:MAG: hypothetical protein M3348_06480 [Acidobacteriota bacterium]|nr:hypothetical protein [Acidobacteriota bacterium]